MSQDVAEPKDAEEVAEPETGPGLVLDLDGEHAEFRAHSTANQFLLVKYADDLSSGGFYTARALTRLVVGQVVKDEQRRLEAYLEEHGNSEDYTTGLDDALTKCWAGETMLPLVPSSD